ncbi:MAG: glycerol-3-phosphate 1-O-acyltransferase PlsY [Lachnospiraceae bacterium]|nr:glycerol-3-phosphate 1-O-acyltransferase PlsY [Lachnospiraceae bacterium]
MNRLICVLLGYTFGCLQWAYILGKISRQIDIRDYGSGNSGTTNALRVLGRKLGILTLVGDLMKTCLAVLAVTLLWGYDRKALLLWAGVGAILGHNFPFYMQFKGGKGVAVMIGLYAAADPRMLLIAGIPALILLGLTRYVSLSSITYMVGLMVTSLIFYSGIPGGLEVILLTFLMAGTTVVRHHANIQRLLNGTERKLGQRVDITAAPAAASPESSASAGEGDLTEKT